jgi:hypothetical protein
LSLNADGRWRNVIHGRICAITFSRFPAWTCFAVQRETSRARRNDANNMPASAVRDLNLFAVNGEVH